MSPPKNRRGEGRDQSSRPNARGARRQWKSVLMR